ncbi:histidine--tRNA ligase [Haloechinothrix sp. LS1_15]|uniref:histidine--tRNA ligase n=1 Tax=Haloechinothrix sp. LS1_15 TaxID=2652248 RepID=UPI0029482C6E|nr:histidine--tRNA ligase [Haloechinothrix sp. LS1_15]MDV6014116.1 histidine--tRNA ligase [Haloechinothrix sp. LS1_15]
MKIDNSPARGTRDLLPDVVAARDHVAGRIEEVYRRFGYRRIETPALERIERLTGGQGGENEKLIFQVLRRGLSSELPAGTDPRELVDLGLRFDLTVPLARYYSQYRSELPQPFRSFQFGPVWRAERPQKGRYRQFHQCDIDLIGEQGVLAEVELIEATTQALAAVGLSGTTVRLSDRRLLAALASACGVPEEAQAGFFITVDKLDKIGWDGVGEELRDQRGVSAEVVERVRGAIESLSEAPAGKVVDVLADVVPTVPEQVTRDLATTISCLEQFPEQAARWTFDPTLVRGMGYYTGQIFEVSHPAAAGSIAGGGRYDQLIGRFLGTDVPACGFSIGFERIVDLATAPVPADHVAVLYEADVPVEQALDVARRLRGEGRTVSVVRRSGKLSAQLDRLEGTHVTSVVHVQNEHDAHQLPPERKLRGESE